MSQKQEIARVRNWTKARVIGIAAGMGSTPGILTPSEMEAIKEIKKIRDRLLDNWEKGSLELGMNVKIKN